MLYSVGHIIFSGEQPQPVKSLRKGTLGQIIFTTKLIFTNLLGKYVWKNASDPWRWER